MVLQILLRHIDFGGFLMVATKSVILAKFVSIAMSTTMMIRTFESPVMSTRPFCCYSIVFVLLQMLLNYFNGYGRAHSIGIVTQIKIIREPSLVLYVYGLIFG
jgi:hypothetical protein